MSSAIVDIYFYDMDAVEAQQGDFDSVLSADELDRAARFKLPVLARRYCIAHLLLRLLLARQVDRPPAELKFYVGPQGKPHLRAGPAFNMAHSESRLLIGVADSGSLGVDVERIRPIDQLEGLVEQSLSEAERAELTALSQDERSRAFLRAWTRKESLLKAIGTGLAVPLNAFSVSLADNDGNALRDASRVVPDADRWSIRSVVVASDTEAAVAWDRPCFDARLVNDDRAPRPAGKASGPHATRA